MLTNKLANTSTSIFSIMSKMATDFNAINLSQGFPNFESDPKLIALVEKAMKEGYNQYAPMPGDLTLREQILSKIELLHSKKYNPKTEITITAGATQAIFTAVATCIQQGDEVIIFTPAYDCYAPSVELFGGKIIPIQLKPPSYTPDWDEVRAKVSPKTKMIIINSPHNPSGMLFTEDDMLQLQAIAEENNLLVISDEVYEHIVFDGRIHQSAAKFESLAKRTFITASFGKTFHNTGWKMGYCVAPETLMTAFRKVHQYVVFSVNTPMQKALATYLKDPKNYLELGSFYQQKRDLFIDLLKGSRFKILPSEGTYYQLLDFSNITTESDVSFAERVTKENGVATIPTSVFNSNKQDFRQLRVCFAKTEETLRAAAVILKKL
jgi:methionine transaminase